MTASGLEKCGQLWLSRVTGYSNAEEQYRKTLASERTGEDGKSYEEAINMPTPCGTCMGFALLWVLQAPSGRCSQLPSPCSPGTWTPSVLAVHRKRSGTATSFRVTCYCHPVVLSQPLPGSIPSEHPWCSH